MKRSQIRRVAIVGCLLLPFISTAYGQTPAGTPAEAPSVKNLEGLLGAPVVRYDSGNRRDPFLSRMPVKKQDVDEELPRGPQPPGIAGMYIAQVTLLGVAVREGSQTAVFQGSDKRAYFLQEGDRLFDGHVTRIEPDSVTLLRETKLRSGKILTQTVTKRLREP